MEFKDQLKTLMDIYRIGNAPLAKGLGIDPSLVSRWRSGERLPARFAVTMGKLAHYLSGVRLLPYDRQTLETLLGMPCDSREHIAAALQAWLLNHGGQTPPAGLRPEESGLMRQAFAHLCTLFGDRPPPPAGPSTLWPRVQKGRPAEHESFSGRAGKRQAAINFLHAAVSAAKPGEVFLFSPEDSLWLREDASFWQLWRQSLHVLAEQGSQVHMMMNGEQTVSSILVDFGPHLAAGGLTVYQSQTESGLRPTLLAARDRAAMVSYTPAGTEPYTLLFRSEADAGVHAHLCRAYIEEGRPLVYACASAPAYYERLAALQAESGPGFAIWNTLNAALLTETRLKSLLYAAFAEPEASRRFLGLQRCGQALRNAGAKRPVTLFVPSAVLTQTAADEGRLSGLYDAGARRRPPDGELWREALRSLMALMRDNKHVQVRFCEELPSMNLFYKEGKGALFTGENEGCVPAALFLGEAGLCGALSRWFEAQRAQPDGHARAQTEKWLEEALARLP